MLSQCTLSQQVLLAGLGAWRQLVPSPCTGHRGEHGTSTHPLLILLLLDFQQVQTCERARVIKPSLTESFFLQELPNRKPETVVSETEGNGCRSTAGRSLLELLMWLMTGAAWYLHCPVLLHPPRATTSATIPPLVWNNRLLPSICHDSSLSSGTFFHKVHVAVRMWEKQSQHRLLSCLRPLDTCVHPSFQNQLGNSSRVDKFTPCLSPVTPCHPR